MVDALNKNQNIQLKEHWPLTQREYHLSAEANSAGKAMMPRSLEVQVSTIGVEDEAPGIIKIQ